MDQHLWDVTDHNPVKLLGKINQERLEALAEDATWINSSGIGVLIN